MKKYLGLISVLVFVLGIGACFVIFPSITQRADFTFSDFGVIPDTSLLFNLTLIVGGIINLFYADYMRRKLNLKMSHPLTILLYISSLSLIGVGLFPYNLNSTLHDIFAGVIFDLFQVTMFFVARLYKNKRGRLIQFFCVASIIITAFAFQFILPRAIAEGSSVLFTFLIYVILSDM